MWENQRNLLHDMNCGAASLIPTASSLPDILVQAMCPWAGAAPAMSVCPQGMQIAYSSLSSEGASRSLLQTS